MAGKEEFQALGDEEAPESEVLEVEEKEAESGGEAAKSAGEKEEKEKETEKESGKEEGETEEKAEAKEEEEEERPLSDAEVAIAKAKAEAAAGKTKPPAAVPLYPLLKKPTIIVTLVEPAGVVTDAGVTYPILITVGSRFSHTIDLTFAAHRSVSEAIAAGHPTIIPPPFPETKMFTNMVTNIEARSERGEEIRQYYETIMSKSGYLKSEHVHKAFGISPEQRKMLRKAGRRMWKCKQQERQLAAIEEAKKILEEEEEQKQSMEKNRLLAENLVRSQKYRSEGEEVLLLEAEVALRLVRPAITLLGPLMNVVDAEEQAWFSVRKLDSSRWNKWAEWAVVNQQGLPLAVLRLDYSGAVLAGQQLHLFKASIADKDEDGVATGAATASAEQTYNAKQLRKEDKLLLEHVATVSCANGKSTVQLLDAAQYAPWKAPADCDKFTLTAQAKTTVTGTAADRELFNELHFFAEGADDETPPQRRAAFYKVAGWRPSFDIVVSKGNCVVFYVSLAVAFALLMDHDKTITYEATSAVVL